MARKTQRVVIETEGRDKGKVFVVNEMSTKEAEKWAIRAFLALARSGVDVPEDITSRGFAGIAIMGLKALGQMNFYDAEPLLDEMFEMVQVIPDPNKPNIRRGWIGNVDGLISSVGPMVESDIEEVSTRLKLRKEMLSLHVNFSTAADILKSQ